VANPAIAVAATRERSLRWPIVGLLTVGVIIAYVNRINLSSALPEMRKSFALSPQASGILLSAFFWSYALLQIPAGWVVDRFGVKWPYAIAFLFWSVISGLTALSTTLASLVVIRVMLGIGESLVTPASMRYLGSNFVEKERGFAIGIYMSGTKIGPAIGAPIAAYLVAYHGWQAMFVVTGLGALLWLVPWLFLVRNDGPAGPAPRAATKAASPAAGKAAPDSLTWGALAASPVMWGTFLATFSYMYFVYFCMTWMPTYFKDRYHMSLTGSGWYTFMSFGGMAAVAILSGLAADRLIGRGHNPVTVRKWFTIVGFMLAFSEIIPAFIHSQALTLFIAVFSLSGLGLATANYWALTQTLVPGATLGRVAGIAAPWITGMMVQKTGTFNAPLIAIGFWLAAGIGCYLFLVKEKYAPR
jgi:MFS family permease